MPKTHKYSTLRQRIRADATRRARVDLLNRATADALRLADLRDRKGVSQQSLAATLAVSQANVSRIEHEDDVYLSTLRRYVEALGGQLEVTATFGDETEPLTANAADADTSHPLGLGRLSVLAAGWAPAAVDHARNTLPLDIVVADPYASTAENAARAQQENSILYTVKTSTASVLRLSKIGLVVILASKAIGSATQTKLFERVSVLLLNQSQSPSGLPAREQIFVDRDLINVQIPLTLETA
jgi:transcriptional regulator with XRE-family HTH domain